MNLCLDLMPLCLDIMPEQRKSPKVYALRWLQQRFNHCNHCLQSLSTNLQPDIAFLAQGNHKISVYFPRYNMLESRKEDSVLFNDALNVFHLQLYSIRHVIKDHLRESKRKFIASTLWDNKKFHLAASNLLYALFHREDSTSHGLCSSSCGALAGSNNP